ncbi:hypothetical protein CLIB1444_05S04038 [[Candida] jaroonii]|uniref:Uncharacterized protein n=1 Tax=[Candida] jaroonii TaxID=467808 RepID=A0ACA9Y8S2_9ASCO|nr:hypothetical protein CLIB1444_05S04038 [[Candida] jaroonii]
MFKVLSTFKSFLSGHNQQSENGQRQQQDPEDHQNQQNDKDVAKRTVSIANMILKNPQFHPQNVNTQDRSNDPIKNTPVRSQNQHRTNGNASETILVSSPFKNSTSKSAFKQSAKLHSSSGVIKPSPNSPWKPKGFQPSKKISDKETKTSVSPWKSKNLDSIVASNKPSPVSSKKPVSISPWRMKSNGKDSPSKTPNVSTTRISNIRQVPTSSGSTPQKQLDAPEIKVNAQPNALEPSSNTETSTHISNKLTGTTVSDKLQDLNGPKSKSPWKTKVLPSSSISKDAPHKSNSPWKQKIKPIESPREAIRVSSEPLKEKVKSSPWKQSVNTTQKEIATTHKTKSGNTLESLLREAASPVSNSPWAVRSKSTERGKESSSKNEEVTRSNTEVISPNSETPNQTPSKPPTDPARHQTYVPSKESSKVNLDAPDKVQGETPKETNPQTSKPDTEMVPSSVLSTFQNPSNRSKKSSSPRFAQELVFIPFEQNKSTSAFAKKRKAPQPAPPNKKSKASPSPVVQAEVFKTTRLPDESIEMNLQSEASRNEYSTQVRRSWKSNIREEREINSESNITSVSSVRGAEFGIANHTGGHIIIPQAIPPPNFNKFMGPPDTVLPSASSLLKHGITSTYKNRISILNLTNPEPNEEEREAAQVVNLPQQIDSTIPPPVLPVHYVNVETVSDGESDEEVKRYTRRGRAKHKDSALKNNLKNTSTTSDGISHHVVRIDPSDDEDSDNEMDANEEEGNSTFRSMTKGGESSTASERRQRKEQRRTERRLRRVEVLYENYWDSARQMRIAGGQESNEKPIHETNGIFVTESESERETLANQTVVTIQSIEENLEQERRRDDPSSPQVQQSSVILPGFSQSNGAEKGGEDYMIDSDDTMYSDLGSTESEDNRTFTRVLRSGKIIDT